MRRLLSWVQAQEASAVGAFGLSLGGFTTALFASLTDGLSCAVPGIPVSDLRRVLERHAAPHQIRYAQTLGYDFDRIGEVLRVISPLALTPRVPFEGRMFFAANADRLVPPDQVRDLWRHWEEPEIVWYEGTHVSFMNERSVWTGVDRTLRENGLAI
jgi:dienelactone hydrolase